MRLKQGPNLPFTSPATRLQRVRVAFQRSCFKKYRSTEQQNTASVRRKWARDYLPD